MNGKRFRFRTGMPETVETVEKRTESFRRIVEKAPDSFLNFIGASRKIREEYPDARIISGLSNISRGLPGRKTLNHAFLIGAMMNGMDSAIMDPLNRDTPGGVYAAEALLGIDGYCIEYLSAYRDDLFGMQK